MLCRCVDAVFEDKRLSTVILTLWLGTVVAVFMELGMFNSTYMNMGPSPHTMFMTVKIDTWDRWYLVAWFTFVNTCVNDFFSDAISPWLFNTVVDHKSRYLNYPKAVCLLIAQATERARVLGENTNAHAPAHRCRCGPCTARR